MPPVPEATGPGPAPFRPSDAHPHAHAVCRQCGRIADVELTGAELELLRGLATQRPIEWTVDDITFSIAGTCPRCRAAQAARI